MEKDSYRENLEILMTAFPGRVTITPHEAAKVMSVDVRTVYSSMSRVKNPLPSTKLSSKKAVIPIGAFAKWMS